MPGGQGFPGAPGVNGSPGTFGVNNYLYLLLYLNFQEKMQTTAHAQGVARHKLDEGIINDQSFREFYNKCLSVLSFLLLIVC